MNVVVTGGLGFIGSHFIEYFLSMHPYSKIIIVDKGTYAANLANVFRPGIDPDRLDIRSIDICYADAVETVFSEQVDSIFNFAAESHNDRAIEDPSSAARTNFMGVFNLLEAARRHKVRRFVQISTDEVYGSTEGTFTEGDPFEPNQPYSAAKAGGELLVRSYNKTFNLNTIITRGANSYGTHQYPEKLIPLAVTNVLEGKSIPVYGSGLQVREWIDVRDHCEGVYAAWSLGASGEAYNIGSNYLSRNIDVVNKIASILKAKGFNPQIEFVGDRPGHDFRYSLNTEKLSRLGFYARRDLFEELPALVDWYVDNETWWKPTKTSASFRTFVKK